MSRLPAIFISHGAPTLVIDDSSARDFIVGLGRRLPRPAAIAVVSAHWETRLPLVDVSLQPPTIHDFRGFPSRLYDMHYPAPGAVAVAHRIVELLRAAGMPMAATAMRGLDHGAWVPLSLMFPDADIPVTQLSVQPHAGPRHHFEIGRALSALGNEGVLVIGSGALTHDLSSLNSADPAADTPAWVGDFAEWIAGRIARADWPALLDYRTRAPFAARNHPTEEHLLPLFVTLGAGGETPRGVRLHSSQTYGVLAMDAYAFGNAT